MKILGPSRAEEQSAASPTFPGPSSLRPPLSTRRVRLRTFDAKSRGAVDALASSMLGDGKHAHPPTAPLPLPSPPDVPEAPRPLLTSEQAS